MNLFSGLLNLCTNMLALSHGDLNAKHSISLYTWVGRLQPLAFSPPMQTSPTFSSCPQAFRCWNFGKTLFIMWSIMIWSTHGHIYSIMKMIKLACENGQCLISSLCQQLGFADLMCMWCISRVQEPQLCNIWLRTIQIFSPRHRNPPR